MIISTLLRPRDLSGRKMNLAPQIGISERRRTFPLFLQPQLQMRASKYYP